jgi:hypothetical protein
VAPASPARLAWRSINYNYSLDVPMDWHAPGCYAVYLDGELVYIGQSRLVRGRLVSHRIHPNIFADCMETPWGQAGKVLIKFKPSHRSGDWLMREFRLVSRLKPRGNMLLCGRGKAVV